MAERTHITINISDAQIVAVADVITERKYQEKTFGDQHHDLAWWQVILTKQVGQIADKMTKWRWGGKSPKEIRRECVQVAAVAMAMIESIDREDYVNEITTAVPTDKRQLSYAAGTDDEHLPYDEEAYTPTVRNTQAEHETFGRTGAQGMGS